MCFLLLVFLFFSSPFVKTVGTLFFFCLLERFSLSSKMGGKFVGKVIGFSCIFSIAFCWAMTGELTQNLQTPGSEDYYPKVFFFFFFSNFFFFFL